MELSLKVNKDNLEVTISNNAQKAVRVWELHNSWGWFTIYFNVTSQQSNSTYIISRKEREWTKDGPTFFEIPSGQSFTAIINLNDGWWQSNKEIKTIKNDVIYIGSVLEVSLTPEAGQYGVFTGKAESSKIISAPPHLWLLGVHN